MDRSDILGIEPGRTFRMVAQPLELRADTASPDTIIWRGYASVTEHAYPIWGGEWPGWNETIARGAFKKTLAEGADVAFLVNHDGMTLARTKNGTMTLAEDDRGLLVEASLDLRCQASKDLFVAAERGDITEMSFAFRVVKDEWADESGAPAAPADGVQRRITEVSLNRGDVSAVNYGANDATTGEFSRIAQAFAELRAGRPLDQELSTLVRTLVDGAPVVRREEVESQDTPSDYPLDPALARAAAAKARRR